MAGPARAIGRSRPARASARSPPRARRRGRPSAERTCSWSAVGSISVSSTLASGCVRPSPGTPRSGAGCRSRAAVAWAAVRPRRPRVGAGRVANTRGGRPCRRRQRCQASSSRASRSAPTGAPAVPPVRPEAQQLGCRDRPACVASAPATRGAPGDGARPRRAPARAGSSDPRVEPVTSPTETAATGCATSRAGPAGRGSPGRPGPPRGPSSWTGAPAGRSRCRAPAPGRPARCGARRRPRRPRPGRRSDGR